MSVPRHRMSAGGQGQNPEFILRDFSAGMSNSASREAIQDDEFYWIKNIMPLDNANMVVAPMATPLATLNLESTVPTYVMAFQNDFPPVGTPGPFIFVVFRASGNAYVIEAGSGTVRASTAGFGSGTTYATQYGNQGILIVNTVGGYQDFSVTTPGAFTPWNNSVTGATNTTKNSVASNTSLQQIVTTAGGVGGTFDIHYQVISATINAPGAGYVVGDVLTFADGGYNTPASVVVATVGGGGAITAIVSNALIGGDYNGPSTGGPAVAVGPTGTAFGGTGAGATFTCVIQAFKFQVLTPGHGYANTDTVVDQKAGPVTVDAWTLTVSGIIAGNSVATYAGRVWISNNRTVFVSDINSYNFFGGAGLSFTINDSYLLNNITVLYSTNNYLYIFGDTSVDVLSNVTVSASTGLTSFTRINVTTSVGTSDPMSVFGYYRGVVFFHRTGVYLMTGATPQRISEKISGVIRNLIWTSNGLSAAGCTVHFQGELCIAMQIAIHDVFTPGAGGAPPPALITMIFFRNRWWIYDFLTGTVSGPNVCSIVGNTIATVGVVTMFGFGNLAGGHPQLLQAFGSNTLSQWTLITKLWDGGAPLREKQSINATIGTVLKGGAASQIFFTVDTELGSSPQVQFPIVGTPSTYQLLTTTAVQGAATGPAQYIGLTITGNQNASSVHLVALRAKTERDILT